MTQVKLISYSKSADGLNLGNCQELVAYCARVSNPSNQMNTETSDRLINYLIRHKHWSPLEMVNACLEIHTTRDIAHQIVRHRSFAFQEFSQRYADPSSMGEMFVTREARLQDAKNRQASHDIPMNDKIHDQWLKRQVDVIDKARDVYKWAIANGIAKEQARVILPEGLTRTKLYMNGSLRSWIHYIELRADIGTQKEHREIALACAEVIAEIFPMTKDIVD